MEHGPNIGERAKINECSRAHCHRERTLAPTSPNDPMMDEKRPEGIRHECDPDAQGQNVSISNFQLKNQF